MDNFAGTDSYLKLLYIDQSKKNEILSFFYIYVSTKLLKALDRFEKIELFQILCSLRKSDHTEHKYLQLILI